MRFAKYSKNTVIWLYSYMLGHFVALILLLARVREENQNKKGEKGGQGNKCFKGL